MFSNLRPSTGWFLVGVLLALTIAALPSFGLFIAPLALIAIGVAVYRTKGRGVLGFAVGVVVLIAVLFVVAKMTA